MPSYQRPSPLHSTQGTRFGFEEGDGKRSSVAASERGAVLVKCRAALEFAAKYFLMLSQVVTRPVRSHPAPGRHEVMRNKLPRSGVNEMNTHSDTPIGVIFASRVSTVRTR
jgi:hypothetical protein